MIDFILNRLDLLIYAVIFTGIYLILLWLWRKVATLETSVGRLDRTLANIQKDKYDDIETSIPIYMPKPMPIPSYPDKATSKIIEEVDADVGVDTNAREEMHEEILKDNDENDNDDDTDKFFLDETEEQTPSVVKGGGSVSKTKLLKMNVEGVKEVAKSKGIEIINGTKAEIIDKILSIV